MKPRVTSVTLALALIAGGSLLAQAFGLRTGSWSFTMTMKGDMAMEGMPSAARAQIAEQLSKPQVFTSCVTAEDLAKLRLGKLDEDDEEEEACKTVSTKVTATVADITRECSGDQAGTEISHFEAPTPQTLKGVITKKGPKGTTTLNLTGKWLAAQCSE